MGMVFGVAGCLQDERRHDHLLRDCHTSQPAATQASQATGGEENGRGDGVCVGVGVGAQKGIHMLGAMRFRLQLSISIHIKLSCARTERQSKF
jgi:hypothetical protein